MKKPIYNEFQDRLLNIKLSYFSRVERNKFFAKFVFDYKPHSILNLGSGGKRHFHNLYKELDPSCEIYDIDIYGDADALIDLDSVSNLDFVDGAFDAVIALDLLEHLEQFHLIIHEMLRISRSKIYITLPIASFDFVNKFLMNRVRNNQNDEGVYTKYYGLPLNHPGDRHRWFLYADDILRYFLFIENKYDVNVNFVEPAMAGKIGFLRRFVSKRIKLNLFTSHIGIVITKKKGT